MTAIRRSFAEKILSEKGWLSTQPAAFSAEVLRRSNLMRFAADEIVFHFGGAPGGIYGLVHGTATVNTAPPDHAPRLIHIGTAGAWTGEGCFLSGQPRRIELRALTDIAVMHLPLDAMKKIAATNSSAALSFAQLLMLSTDLLIEIIHSLQNPDVTKRIAAILCRASHDLQHPIPLAQSEIGLMANASRKQVNAALKRFAEEGWINAGYKAISVRDSSQLRRFAEENE